MYSLKIDIVEFRFCLEEEKQNTVKSVMNIFIERLTLIFICNSISLTNIIDNFHIVRLIK